MNEPTSTTNVAEPPSAQVTLVIPCLAEYVGVARLAMLGVANRMALSYDEVEDVRLAVGEACTHAIERASDYTESDGSISRIAMLTIDSYISASKLTIEVQDSIPTSEQMSSPESDTEDYIDYQKLGAVLMEILVDEVDVISSSTGTVVRLVKYALAT